MSTVNFAANTLAYYLNVVRYETLQSEEVQCLVRVHSCKVRKRRKTV